MDGHFIAKMGKATSKNASHAMSSDNVVNANAMFANARKTASIHELPDAKYLS